MQVLAAALLISNTIRVAAFSRRRETGIMRLVGASNLYIQLPFLLEGAIAGLVGAVLASGVLIAIKQFFIDARLARGLPVHRVHRLGRGLGGHPDAHRSRASRCRASRPSSPCVATCGSDVSAATAAAPRMTG